MPKSDQHRLTIRLTGEEYALIQAKAGEKALAVFIRETVLDDATARRMPTRKVVLKDRAAIAQVLAKLGTSRLVDAFRATEADVRNGVISLSSDDQATLAQISGEISNIKDLLMAALGVRNP